MFLQIRQEEKGLFLAKFVILDENVREVGTISFQGGIGSMEGTFQIWLYGRRTTLRPCRKKDAVAMMGRRKPGNLYRPYTVSGDGHNGVMLHDQAGGFFSVNPMNWHFLRLDGRDYKLYHVGFGRDGIRAPIYDGNTCVAEIRKPCLITDGLHGFDVWLNGAEQVLPAVCLCCYMYVITYYEAGTLIKSGKTMRLYTTKKRELLDKCDNQFARIPCRSTAMEVWRTF